MGMMWGVLYRSLASAIAVPGVAAQVDGMDRIPIAVVVRAFRDLAASVGDPDFGLHAATRVEMGAFEVLDFVTRSSATLGDAMDRACRYYKLVNDTGGLVLERGEPAQLVLHTGAELIDRRHTVEFLFAAIVSRARRLLLRPWKLAGVSFAHPRPASVETHVEIFQAPVEFGQKDDRILFSGDQLAIPIASAEPELASLLDSYAAALVARSAPSIVERVRRAVVDGLAGGTIDLNRIAERLSMAPRTVQRELARAGTSYSVVLEEVRRELAARYVRDARLTLGEVAFLLGYSEPAAFHRAFRRWYEVTPGDYRGPDRS